MNQVKVTVVSSVISDRGEKRLKEHNANREEVLTEEQCENLGIPYKHEDSIIELEDEDFEIIEREFYIFTDKIITYGYSEYSEFTEMFLKDDVILSVKERPRIIYNRINKLNNK